MRLQEKLFLKDHDLLPGQDPEDHHPPGEHFRILLNFWSIGAGGTRQFRQSLTYDGHKTIRAILRGSQATDIQGHTGVFVIGSDTQQESAAVSIKPYGGGGYPTSYMGGYSRLHGDSYLTPNLWGAARLVDVWIDGDEAVFEFYNSNAILGIFIAVYGAVHVK